MFTYRNEEGSNDFDITICILLFTVIITEVLFGVHKAESVDLAVLYVLSVFFISYLTSGYHFGLASAVTLSFLYYNYRPAGENEASYDDMIRLGIMLLTTIVISIVISRTRVRVRTATQRADRSDLIYEINQQLLTAPNLAAIVDCAMVYAKQQIGRSIVFYTEDPLVSGSGSFSEQDSALNTEAQRAEAHHYFVNPDAGATQYSDSVEFYYYPVKADHDIVILIGIYFEYSSISKNDVIFVRNLMEHVGVAAELRSVLYMKHSADLESEREKARNTLLRSVSHDLRTPLTGILGESTLIADHVDSLEPEDIKLYAEDIKENAQWLIRMVENLLIVTKLTGNAVDIVKVDGDIEESMAQAASIVRKRYTGANISVDAAKTPVYVPMDATLITQVLINLLDNAVKHSPEGATVKLALEKSAKHVSLIVSDEGKGIEEKLLSDILNNELTEMKSADSKKGFGLGLTICKTIVKAHGGAMTIGKSSSGGAMVSVLLPLER